MRGELDGLELGESTPAKQARSPSLPDGMLGGRYRVRHTLGRGGMGTVYAAEDMTTGQAVAINTLHPALAQSREFTERLLREARAASAIADEHVARVLEVGRLDDGGPYVVMELLEGETLDAYASQRAPLPIAHAVDL